MNRPHRIGRTLLTALGLAVVVAACGSDDASSDTSMAQGASIEIYGAWARTSPMVATAGAIYLTIENSGGSNDALIGASVDPSIAGTVELHETVEVAADDSTTMTGSIADGMSADYAADSSADMMEMQPVDQIVAPAAGSATLEPGGYHIMLLDLVEPLAVGSTLDVTLTFETSGDRVVTVDVRDTAP